MSEQIRVNTEQVGQIAGNIERYNAQLDEALNKGRATVQNLANLWDGKASQETIAAFNSFAARFFEIYRTMMDNYVKFLRTNVQSGYFETEQANVTLADAFD